MKSDLNGYIGVFDSGVGGISVLKEMTKYLPDEKFYFYGDSKHAPYGEKSIKEIQDRTLETVNKMVNRGIKGIVIACNTATSAAIEIVRAVYPDIVVIGVEPAIKPAVEKGYKRVLVAATKNTLDLEKFHELAESLDSVDDIIPLPCVGLAGSIEKGHINDEETKRIVHELFGPYKDKVDCVVFGCTHYPFIKETVLEELGDIPVFDGSTGTALQLKKCLGGNLSDAGEVVFDSSLQDEEELKFYQYLYEL